MGLSLYQPRNGSTYNSVKNWIQQNSNIIVPNFLWLGIKLDNANKGSYLSDGTPITFEDWVPGQPNGCTLFSKTCQSSSLASPSAEPGGERR